MEQTFYSEDKLSLATEMVCVINEDKPCKGKGNDTKLL